MKFDILSFQFVPELAFKHSYLVNSFLKKEISKSLRNINSNLELILSISCYRNNKDELLLVKKSIGRKNKNSITQFVSFPSDFLEYRNDYVLKLSQFDFEFTKNAYRTIPVNIYANLVIDAVVLFLRQEKIQTKKNFEELKKKCSREFSLNPGKYAYKNQEVSHLEYLQEGNEKDVTWFQTEAGKKWTVLLSKYKVNEKGELEKMTK